MIITLLSLFFAQKTQYSSSVATLTTIKTIAMTNETAKTTTTSEKSYCRYLFVVLSLGPGDTGNGHPLGRFPAGRVPPVFH